MSLARSLVLGAALVGAPGCMAVKYTSPTATALGAERGEVHKTWGHSLFFGMVPVKKVPLDGWCPETEVHTIKSHVGPFGGLMTVLTLGVWTPTRVRVTCAAPGPAYVRDAGFDPHVLAVYTGELEDTAPPVLASVVDLSDAPPEEVPVVWAPVEPAPMPAAAPVPEPVSPAAPPAPLAAAPATAAPVSPVAPAAAPVPPTAPAPATPVPPAPPVPVAAAPAPPAPAAEPVPPPVPAGLSVEAAHPAPVAPVAPAPVAAAPTPAPAVSPVLTPAPAAAPALGVSPALTPVAPPATRAPDPVVDVSPLPESAPASPWSVTEQPDGSLVLERADGTRIVLPR